MQPSIGSQPNASREEKGGLTSIILFPENNITRQPRKLRYIEIPERFFIVYQIPKWV